MLNIAPALHIRCLLTEPPIVTLSLDRHSINDDNALPELATRLEIHHGGRSDPLTDISCPLTMNTHRCRRLLLGH